MSEILHECVDYLKEYHNYVTQYLEDPKKSLEIDKIKNYTEKYCDAENDTQKYLKASEEITKYVTENSSVDLDELDRIYQENLVKYTKTIKDYKNERIWKEIFISGNDEVAEIEPETENQLEMTEYDELDDSLFASNVFTPPVDPICKRIIENPFKNRKCGHVYEYNVITEYVKQRKRKAKCPYMGCKNDSLTLTDLVKDEELLNKIKDYLQRNPVQNNSLSD